MLVVFPSLGLTMGNEHSVFFIRLLSAEIRLRRGVEERIPRIRRKKLYNARNYKKRKLSKNYDLSPLFESFSPSHLSSFALRNLSFVWRRIKEKRRGKKLKEKSQVKLKEVKRDSHLKIYMCKYGFPNDSWSAKTATANCGCDYEWEVDAGN